MSLSTFQIIFNEPALLFTFKMKEEIIPPQKAKTYTPIPNIPARQVVLSLSLSPWALWGALEKQQVGAVDREAAT